MGGGWCKEERGDEKEREFEFDRVYLGWKKIYFVNSPCARREGEYVSSEETW